MRLVDYLTLTAIVTGPIVAILIQLWFEQYRSKRKQRVEILNTLLEFRGRMASPEMVSALNRMALVFHDDSNVIEKHAALFAHWEWENSLPEERKRDGYERRNDHLAELIYAVAESVGYKFDQTKIKSQFYLPKWMTDETEYTMAIRQKLLDLSSGKVPLKVRVVEQEE